MPPVKLIISSKSNLQFKYGKDFSKITQLLSKMKAADKKRNLDTKVVFIDDATSAKAAGISAVKAITEKSCKQAVDDLYKKHIPAYIVILGAQDVIPFQEITNPAEDEDLIVPSDLPYACDAPYSRTIDAFTGPTRVVGRIPDIPGQKNISYLQKLISNAINHKPKNPDEYRSYFAVSAQVWRKSTELNCQRMFSSANSLLLSPVKSETTAAKYTKTQLKPLTHFYNCHGARVDHCYWGQRGQNYPEAIRSSGLTGNISTGTVVAAECCYGAQLFDPTMLQPEDFSIANIYLGNGAIALVGSSTIAYGPAESNELADLITQYFIKSVLKGASTGRAFLEARQRYLTDSGPQLNPYELKTLAQFYLLGDPSVQPATCDDVETTKAMVGNTIENSRANLSIKGMNLKNNIAPSKKESKTPKPGNQKQLKEILKTAQFEDAEKEIVYSVKTKSKASGLQKKLTGENARFRTFIKPGKTDDLYHIKVLVVKEDEEQVLGWRVYESR